MSTITNYSSIITFSCIHFVTITPLPNYLFYFNDLKKELYIVFDKILLIFLTEKIFSRMLLNIEKAEKK